MPRGKCMKPHKKPIALSSWEGLPALYFNTAKIAEVRFEHIRHMRLILPPSHGVLTTV